MKKTRILFLFVLVAIGLTACSFTKFDGSRTGNESQFILNYELLNATETQSLELVSGDIVSFKITSESGKVDIVLQMDKKEPVYSGADIPTSSFEVEISESGTYNCSVIGEKAKGSVSVIKRYEQ